MAINGEQLLLNQWPKGNRRCGWDCPIFSVDKETAAPLSYALLGICGTGR